MIQSNPFKYSDDNKRYHTLNYHYKHTFKNKVFKVVLDAGFSCPHIINGQGGCSFCSIRGSGDFALSASTSLAKQYDYQKQVMQRKWPQGLPIAYFQAYTNTYAALDTLKLIYDPFYSDQFDNVGVALGTRADCLSDATIEYFHQQALLKPTTIEIGVQSIHEITNQRINRGHQLDVVENILKKCVHKNFDVVLHLINGLPHEDESMMLKSARWVAKQPIAGLKLHMLHLLKGTKMAKDYEKEPFKLLEMDEFIDIVIKQLEVLPPEMVIHRITGDGLVDDLIGPLWTIKKRVVLNNIDKEMVARNSYQGKYYASY